MSGESSPTGAPSRLRRKRNDQGPNCVRSGRIAEPRSPLHAEIPASGRCSNQDRRRLGIDRNRLCRLPPPDQESAAHRIAAMTQAKAIARLCESGVDRSLQGRKAASPPGKALRGRAFSPRLASPLRTCPPEFGAVGSWRQISILNRMRRTVLGMVLLRQLLPYFVGGHPDDGCCPVSKSCGSWKSSTPIERSFRDRRAANRVLDDILQELPASLARAKAGLSSRRMSSAVRPVAVTL